MTRSRNGPGAVMFLKHYCPMEHYFRHGTSVISENILIWSFDFHAFELDIISSKHVLHHIVCTIFAFCVLIMSGDLQEALFSCS